MLDDDQLPEVAVGRLPQPDETPLAASGGR